MELLLHPDFELYDNVGHTSDQIHSAHAGIATTADLHRWARRDAAALLQRHGLPSPPSRALDLRPFEATLAQTTTTAEISVVVLAALNAADQIISDLNTFLTEAGDRYHSPALTEPRRFLWTAAAGLLACMNDAAEGVEIALRETYDPAPARPAPKPSPDLPPPPPSPPSSGPTPSR
ncbi:hypothetical protein [Streptomyces sp. NPDC088915]|uniref:hypothetical protein n=1 Tax=Streptomyces sp. NPDC088915 TaxID=3365912 RepID=UPI00382AFAD1